VLKYQLNMTAKSYIPQPIYRLKKLPPSLCEDPHARPDDLVYPRTPMAPKNNMTKEEMLQAIAESRANLAEIEKSLLQK
jgi:hypothetical protein